MAGTSDLRHRSITSRVLVETLGILGSLGAVSVFLGNQQGNLRFAAIPLMALQGCWFYRLYMVGHEGAHRKLLRTSRFMNDVVGQGALVPLLVPLRIFRKIHAFHHGQNRRDHKTAVLDTFVVNTPPSSARRTLLRGIFFWNVFGGGYFLQSLVSIMLFLFLPLSVARKVSPAFKGWTVRDQLVSVAQFVLGLAFHVVVVAAFGWDAWLFSLGMPLLAFAWVYSLMVYIFHYDTSYGRPVTANVRNLDSNAVVRWWLMNFNEHATHHEDATIPWYDLPSGQTDHGSRQSLLSAIGRQFAGPNIVVEERV